MKMKQPFVVVSEIGRSRSWRWKAEMDTCLGSINEELLRRENFTHLTHSMWITIKSADCICSAHNQAHTCNPLPSKIQRAIVNLAS